MAIVGKLLKVICHDTVAAGVLLDVSIIAGEIGGRMVMAKGSDWLEPFVRQHGAGLMGLAYTLTGSREAAEEAVQEVWAKLAKRDPRTIEQPLAYARRAVANECATRGRRMARRGRRARALEDECVRLDQVRPDPNGRAEILSALSILNPRERTAVVARYYLGLDDVEAADIIGCAVATVRSLHSRAMRKLRTQLDHQEELHHDK